MEQERPTLSEHLSSSLVFIGVRVARSLVLFVVFCCSLLALLFISVGHCVVCTSAIYCF